MEPPQEQEADSLATLEERIRQAIDLVTRLRREAAEAREEAAKLTRELEALRAERQQVRTRIEKLLSQIDALSAV